MPADINEYFLATSMARVEYMKVQYQHISEDIKLKYNLKDKVTPMATYISEF